MRTRRGTVIKLSFDDDFQYPRIILARGDDEEPLEFEDMPGWSELPPVIIYSLLNLGAGAAPSQSPVSVTSEALGAKMRKVT